MSGMSDFDDYPFSLPQNWGKRIDLKKFFFTTEERILETNFCQVLQQLNDYSENDFVLKLTIFLLVATLHWSQK